jgi:hypothetical protein
MARMKLYPYQKFHFKCLFFCISHFFSLLLPQAELNYLGDLVHPNLVKLIGFCIEDDQRLLVYEFMPRGSLENHLFRRTLLTFLFLLYVFTAL